MPTYRVAVPFRESHISQRNATHGFLYVHNEQSHVPSLTTTRDRFALEVRTSSISDAFVVSTYFRSVMIFDVAET